MNRPRIELHIEELVLHGFSAADPQRIGEAVRQELSRLLQEHRGPDLARHIGNHGRISGGTVHLEQGKGPEATGAQIARAVHGGLTQRATTEQARATGRK